MRSLAVVRTEVPLWAVNLWTATSDSCFPPQTLNSILLMKWRMSSVQSVVRLCPKAEVFMFLLLFWRQEKNKPAVVKRGETWRIAQITALLSPSGRRSRCCTRLWLPISVWRGRRWVPVTEIAACGPIMTSESCEGRGSRCCLMIWEIVRSRLKRRLKAWRSGEWLGAFAVRL